MEIVKDELLEKVIVARESNSHKGNYGRLLLIGGTYPYGGAIIMAALAAVNSGAGLVTVATERDNITALHSHLPEAMAFDLQERSRLIEQIQKATVILIGPGLAEEEREKEVLRTVLLECQAQQILILDGGAISLFSQGDFPWPQAQVIFTPHQKEWQRLGGLSISEQTAEANLAALAVFPKGTILVHKKHGTELYQVGQEEIRKIQAGGPHQATGGMGDTLAGMIAGFAGQFRQVPLFDRVGAATYLHSAIADQLAQEAYVVLPTAISRDIPKWMKKFT